MTAFPKSKMTILTLTVLTPILCCTTLEKVECHLCEQEGWNELSLPSLNPRKHRELLRAIVAVETGISYWRINLKALDAAYSIAFPNSTPINVNKKGKKEKSKSYVTKRN
jgi:hypothetical protein